MAVKLAKVEYQQLNGRQQENYNFQKVSAVLAEYGYVTLRLSDDWQGADFIAQHIDGETFLKVQLKSRLTFCQNYWGKGLYLTFQYHGVWYLFPHDEFFNQVCTVMNMSNTKSWKEKGHYHFPVLSIQLQELLAPYQIA